MSEERLSLDTADKRRTLWIVLALNVALAAGFGITGALGDSSALIANGLDNASDALVYVISPSRSHVPTIGSGQRRASPACCCWSSRQACWSMRCDAS